MPAITLFDGQKMFEIELSDEDALRAKEGKYKIWLYFFILSTK